MVGRRWSSYGVGYYAASEAHMLVADSTYRPDGTRRGALFLHGRSQDATQVVDGAFGFLAEMLARSGTPVLSVDAGGKFAWGNDTAIARVGDAATYLRGAAGAASGKLVVVATSMGALAGLSWAKANPSQVLAVLLGLPVADLADVHDNNRGGYAAEIETAYGGAAGYASGVAAHNPVAFAGSLAGIPVRAVTRSDDTIALPGRAAALVAGIGSSASRVDAGTGGHVLAPIDHNPHVAWVRRYL